MQLRMWEGTQVAMVYHRSSRTQEEADFARESYQDPTSGEIVEIHDPNYGPSDFRNPVVFKGNSYVVSEFCYTPPGNTLKVYRIAGSLACQIGNSPVLWGQKHEKPYVRDLYEKLFNITNEARRQYFEFIITPEEHWGTENWKLLNRETMIHHNNFSYWHSMELRG